MDECETVGLKMKDYEDIFSELLIRLKPTEKSLIIVAEGLDASGKSGFIRRIVSKADYKNYRIIPISKPTEEEYKFHYMRRFWLSLPEKGKCAIFDRSWYGRVLVERIEGFATENEWSRAYREINEFEKSLTDDGAIIVKLWFDVSEEEQLRRFKTRLETPEKKYKITEEDWRNRGKRGEYDAAMQDMIKYTDKGYAPWIIIPADDKKYARIHASREIIRIVDLFL